MGEFVNVAYDIQSLQKIRNLARFSSILNPLMEIKMRKVGDIVVQAAVANTWAVFQEPTGNLAGTIVAIPNGSLEIDIGSSEGYARRLEEGFHGLDSLGRAYNNEPEPYLMPALEDNADEIIQEMQDAVAETWMIIGA
jgi:hypothetical protein